MRPTFTCWSNRAESYWDGNRTNDAESEALMAVSISPKSFVLLSVSQVRQRSYLYTAGQP
jgi:hypothetical protein